MDRKKIANRRAVKDAKHCFSDDNPEGPDYERIREMTGDNVVELK